jgi:hypothetical protein
VRRAVLALAPACRRAAVASMPARKRHAPLGTARCAYGRSVSSASATVLLERYARDDNARAPCVGAFSPESHCTHVPQFAPGDNSAYRRVRAASPGSLPDPSLEDRVAGILRYIRANRMADFSTVGDVAVPDPPVMRLESITRCLTRQPLKSYWLIRASMAHHSGRIVRHAKWSGRDIRLPRSG